jgi:D-glycero-beta-D-manno-heptose 1-phosphate adenylyltransferase
MTPQRSRLDAIRSRVDTRETLGRKLYLWRLKGQKIVFTNGCFDILHRGHAEYLAKAADLGNVLIVGVNSDASVRRLGKKDSRPLQDEQTRAFIVASLDVVESAIIFDEDTPRDLIGFIQPDVVVKGADYDANETDPKSKKYIAGSDIVRAKGGEVRTIELTEGFSTTAIEVKIKSS